MMVAPFEEMNSADEIAPSRSASFRFNWVEESFTFEKSVGRQVSLPSSRGHLGSNLGQRNIFFCTLMIFGLAVALWLRFFWLQVVVGDAYRRLAENNRQRVMPIAAERGLILDRRGVPLTKNVPNFSLAIVPQELPRDSEERKIVVERLAFITKQDPSELWHLLNEYGSYSFRSVNIRDFLDYDTALAIQIAVADLPGISVERSSKRAYLAATSSLAHVIGYQGKLGLKELNNLRDSGYLPTDLIGKTGLEKTYEASLRGIPGQQRLEVNVVGREQQVLSEIPPRAGTHLKLNIDLAVQSALEKILQNGLTRGKKYRAAGVVLDPRNGAVLALVSLPGFDNNLFANGISSSTYQNYLHDPNQPLFDRAIAGLYPSGSTIKPAIAAGALTDGIINSRTIIHSTGGIRVGPWFFPDWKVGGHGATDVRRSLAWSINTFYYYLGGGYKDFTGLGPDGLKKYMQQFGLGSAVGIDLPGEADGLIPSPEWKKVKKDENWYIGDTYNISIGQGDLLVTPLQIAVMTAAVANGGTVYTPQVVRALVDPLTNEERLLPPKTIHQAVASPAALTVVRQGMRDCVVYGSCQHLAHLSLPVAGKTGTAQWNERRATHAWFTSFAPFDHPEIVLTILVEEGGEGGLTATPIARDFYAWWANYAHKSAN